MRRVMSVIYYRQQPPVHPVLLAPIPIGSSRHRRALATRTRHHSTICNDKCIFHYNNPYGVYYVSNAQQRNNFLTLFWTHASSLCNQSPHQRQPQTIREPVRHGTSALAQTWPTSGPCRRWNVLVSPNNIPAKNVRLNKQFSVIYSLPSPIYLVPWSIRRFLGCTLPFVFPGQYAFHYAIFAAALTIYSWQNSFWY